MIRSLRAIPIDQEGIGIEGMRAILEQLEAGRAVLVFPEGERTYDGMIHTPRPGVALLIKKSQAPVVPVGSPYDDGSGIVLGAAAGAALRHMDGAFVSATNYPPAILLKGILVNADGRRFAINDVIEQVPVLLQHVAQGRLGAGDTQDLFVIERENRRQVGEVGQFLQRRPQPRLDHAPHQVRRRRLQAQRLDGAVPRHVDRIV